MVVVGDGKVSPIKLCIREALEVIFELLKTEPGFVDKDVVDRDVELFGVSWRGRSRHEDEE